MRKYLQRQTFRLKKIINNVSLHNGSDKSAKQLCNMNSSVKR